MAHGRVNPHGWIRDSANNHDTPRYHMASFLTKGLYAFVARRHCGDGAYCKEASSLATPYQLSLEDRQLKSSQILRIPSHHVLLLRRGFADFFPFSHFLRPTFAGPILLR